MFVASMIFTFPKFGQSCLLWQLNCASTAVTTVVYLGRGVAFAVKSEGLALVRTAFRNQFKPWLCPQDLETWQPHITVQNGVDIRRADRLSNELHPQFTPETLAVVGCQL